MKTLILLVKAVAYSFLFVLLFASVGMAGVYKIVKDGKTYYSDVVPDVAESVKSLRNESAAVITPALPAYWPQPQPLHFPTTGAVCYRGWGKPWTCQSGRPANTTSTNVTVNSGGGLVGGLGYGRLGGRHGVARKR